MIRQPTPAPAEVMDRSRKVTFYYGKKEIPAFEGETIASALMASGVSVFSRSFKYHRPRGPHCMSGQCGRCAMTVDGRPNVRTCQTLVRKGIRVEPQSKIHMDPLSLADRADRLMPAGFYYKRFHKPAGLWPRVIRQLRSSGGNHAHVPEIAGNVRFDHVNLAPELLVIGGGPAGLEAALVGARAGVKVVLVEGDLRLGGLELLRGTDGHGPVRELVEEVSSAENITVLLSTYASALYPEGTAFCVQTNLEGGFLERAFHIDPRAVVVATGAAARPLVFAHNDRPGIWLPEAALKMVNLYGLMPDKPVLVSGGDDETAEAALLLSRAGVRVAAHVDYRSAGFDPKVLEALGKAGIPFFPGHTLVRATGEMGVRKVEIARPPASSGLKMDVEAVVVSGGRSPRHKLLGMAGARVAYNPELHMHLPEELPPGFFAAGRVLGLVHPRDLRQSGRLAGARALERLGVESGSAVSECLEALEEARPLPVTPQPQADLLPNKTFVCFCHDVTRKDIRTAFEEGFDNVESAKRYTTATMGPCQGGSCHDNYSAVVSRELREAIPTNPLTTPRPAAVSMSLGALAAGHHILLKRTPLHEAQEREGGRPSRIGPWLRVEHFSDVRAEVRAVHETAGIYDVSTLGKFLLFGPDAEKLWNFVNTNNIRKLKPGRILYTATCNEEGVPVDDGILIRRPDGTYYFTTSTARAAATAAFYGKWRCEKGWKAHLVDWTDRMAGVNLTGPKARVILEGLTEGDLSNGSFPHMHWREMDIAGVSCLVFRLGFTGELSYELHFPAGYAPGLYREILSAGRGHGLRPFGTDALLACRLEKGHVIPGMDTDGNTTLSGAFGHHLGFLWDPDKEDMVGGPVLKHLKGRSNMGVVGFSAAGDAGLCNGYIVKEKTGRLGHVTSVCYSEILGRTIGLALVNNHEEVRKRGSMVLFGDGRDVNVDCHEPPFYDPSGERMRI